MSRSMLMVAGSLLVVLVWTVDLSGQTSGPYEYIFDEQYGQRPFLVMLSRTSSDLLSVHSRRAIDRSVDVFAPDGSSKVTRRETTDYYPVAACAAYSSRSVKQVFVAGVNSQGKTLIERWDLILGLDTQGNLTLGVQKTLVVTPDKRLTHLRGIAASPSASFLVALHHETGNLLKIDLTTEVVSGLLSCQSESELAQVDFLQWRRHTTDGEVFRMSPATRDATTPTATRALLV